MSGTQPLPHCYSLDDIAANNGKPALTIGTYHQFDMRMRPKPPAQYVGYVVLVLEDGNRMLLEPGWSKAAVRSAEERQRYDGHQVEIKGVVHLEMPESDEPAAHVMMPCISPVENIQIRS